jgi:hypothetical protein
MRLVRLVYASTFLSDTVSASQLKKIHEVSVPNNSENEISGMLVFGNDYFLQCLEGGRESVNRLYEKISKDDRHVRALILSYEECHVRNFSKWNMKFLMLTEEQKELIRKYSISGIFNPYNMSGESCIHLLSELSNKYGTDEV